MPAANSYVWVGSGCQRRAVELIEERATAPLQLLEGTLVEPIQQPADLPVQVGEAGQRRP